MNNRIKEAFAHGKAFIPFITCGDPSLEVTEQIIIEMEKAGANLIELGIPFPTRRRKARLFRQPISVRFRVE